MEEWIPDSDARSIAVTRTNVYWVDDDDFIHQSGIDGTQVNDTWLATSFGDDSALAGDLTTDGSHVFWVTQTDTPGGIARAAVDGTGANESFISLDEVPGAIAMTPTVTAAGPPPPAGKPKGTVLLNGKPFQGGPVPFGSVIDVTHGTLTLTDDIGTATIFGNDVTARLRLLHGGTPGHVTDEFRLVGGRHFGVCKQPQRRLAVPTGSANSRRTRRRNGSGARGPSAACTPR